MIDFATTRTNEDNRPITASGRRCAAFIASHNRRIKTLASLQALHSAAVSADIVLRVTLFDDGSTDGTAEAVAARFPQTRVVVGDGNAFWAGGMRSALMVGRPTLLNTDYILLLNDDTILYADALHSLLFTDPSLEMIVVGTVVDPETTKRTYGGLLRGTSIRRLELRAVDQAPFARVQTFNGNAVALTVSAYDRLKGLDPVFSHGLADIDLGLRATKLGIPIMLGRELVGECARNASEGTWKDPGLSVCERWRLLRTPKGLPPREWLVFSRRHGGVLWPIYFVSPLMTVLGLRR
jgi:GT2 family glycosyltransferase